MAALGTVFYQNFIAKKQVIVETDTSVDVKPLTTRVAFDSDIYSLDYPKDWNSETKKIESSTAGASVTTLTSHDGSVQTAFTVSEKAPDTACNVGDGLKVSSYHINDTPVANLADVPVYLVEAIVDSPGGGYNYMIGLTPDGGGTHAAVGDSHCNVKDVGIASTAIVGIYKLAKPTILATITFPKLQPKSGVAIKDMQQIKDVMKTDAYKAAVTILESAHKE